VRRREIEGGSCGPEDMKFAMQSTMVAKMNSLDDGSWLIYLRFCLTIGFPKYGEVEKSRATKINTV
jgi:hypothetical protein